VNSAPLGPCIVPRKCTTTPRNPIIFQTPRNLARTPRPSRRPVAEKYISQWLIKILLRRGQALPCSPKNAIFAVLGRLFAASEMRVRTVSGETSFGAPNASAWRSRPTRPIALTTIRAATSGSPNTSVFSLVSSARAGAGDRDSAVAFRGMDKLIPNLSKFVPDLRGRRELGSIHRLGQQTIVGAAGAGFSRVAQTMPFHLRPLSFGRLPSIPSLNQAKPAMGIPILDRPRVGTSPKRS